LKLIHIFRLALLSALLFGSRVGTAAEAPAASPAAAEDLVVIVNSENPAAALSENDLRDYYFKRKRQWPDGTTVRFLDRVPETPIRKSFLRKFIKKTTEDVELYWIGQKLYSGDSAPLRESSDALTVQFVSSFKGAIGYVSASAALAGRNVKAVKVE
jgi:ABC-type phosphate transport system substrate-binding protein